MTNSDSIPFSAADVGGNLVQLLDIKIAQRILGKKRIFLDRKVAKKWGIKLTSEMGLRLYGETLEDCAKENTDYGQDWRLVFGPGQPMTIMFKKRGEGGMGQPCFQPAFNFYEKDGKDGKELFHEINHMHEYYATIYPVSPWIAEEREADYRLINFNPRFQRVFFPEQEKRISAMGEKFFRTPAPIFAEAIMGIFMLKGERIAENWYHLAPEKHMLGSYPVAIGNFTSYGLAIIPGWNGSGHGVVIMRANDF